MGKGLYHSFELALNKTTGSKFNPEAQEKAREEVFWKLVDRGVFTRIDHDRRVYITPPLIIGEDELDKALDGMLDVMKEVRPA
jgi:adenosylmethionine-8-amino-7-oxononanoate aminotransferase